MKALTIYQPWATFIMAGAKPFEFRGWDYTERYSSILNERIVIHASARAIKPAEIEQIILDLKKGESSLVSDIALPILEKLKAKYKCQGMLEMSAGLGTAIIGKPRRVGQIFSGHPDSDRLNHHLFGWPLSDMQPFDAPKPCRGAQGFWNWPFQEPPTQEKS